MTLGLDERVQVSFSGLLFNANEGTDSDGCYWPAALIGWLTRTTRTQRYPKPVLPGSYRVPNPTAERVFSIEGHCIAPSVEARSRAENRVTALAGLPDNLYRIEVTEEMGTVYRMVELESAETVRISEFVFKYTIQLAAPDPFKYSTSANVAGNSLPVSAGGLDWTDPTGLDWTDSVGLSWGVPSSTGVITMLNNGTAEAWPTFTITAGANSLTNPTITNVFTGQTLAYTGTLNPDDTLVIVTNPFGRSVILNGTADRRPLMTRAEWFSIPAKTTGAVAFSAQSFSATAFLSASWSDTYF